MKLPVIVAVLFFSASLISTAQTSPSVSGTWALAYDVAGISINMTCVVAQADGKLTGSCTGDDKVAHALTGEVKGRSVTFKFDKTSGEPDYRYLHCCARRGGRQDEGNHVSHAAGCEWHFHSDQAIVLAFPLSRLPEVKKEPWRWALDVSVNPQVVGTVGASEIARSIDSEKHSPK